MVKRATIPGIVWNPRHAQLKVPTSSDTWIKQQKPVRIEGKINESNGWCPGINTINKHDIRRNVVMLRNML